MIEQEYNISNNEISKITIFNWDHCNAKCFYCSVSSKYFPNKKKSEYYDALPIIKELIKEKRITPNTFCAVQGGEPTMLEEFPLIIEELLKVNCRIEILSNGIEYNKCIVDVINAKNNNALCISLDCGSRDKYKRIKAVDKYDNVISNIKKYINETKDNEEKIRIKYIILPNINDTKKEIDNFFDICRDCNVISVAASINHSHNHFQNTKLKYRYSVLKTYEYFIKKTW